MGEPGAGTPCDRIPSGAIAADRLKGKPPGMRPSNAVIDRRKRESPGEYCSPLRASPTVEDIRKRQLLRAQTGGITFADAPRGLAFATTVGPEPRVVPDLTIRASYATDTGNALSCSIDLFNAEVDYVETPTPAVEFLRAQDWTGVGTRGHAPNCAPNLTHTSTGIKSSAVSHHRQRRCADRFLAFVREPRSRLG
jgi:hypothetical protein